MGTHPTASARVPQVHSRLARLPVHTGQRYVPRGAENSCAGCALCKENQTGVGGIQPTHLVLSYDLGLD